MEVSMLEAIGTAILEMKTEIERVRGGELSETITSGELQKILDNARHSVRLLKKIKIKDDAYSIYTSLLRKGQLNHYLADSTFVEAVQTVMKS